MKTTPLQLTPETASALHPAVGVMEQSVMQEHSSPDLTELAPFQSGSMTTYSSAYSESTWSDTTQCKNIGQMTSQKMGGEQHDGGKLWFRGATMPNGCAEEFNEDCSTPIRDLSNCTP